MSKTWLIGVLAMFAPQVIDFINGKTPALVALAQAYAPAYLDPLLAGVIPVLSSWLVGMLAVVARNDAVKTGKKADVVTGVKKEWGK